MIGRLLALLRRRRRHSALEQTRGILSGPGAWENLDQLGITGFGTDLLRVDFPPQLSQRADWSHVSGRIAALLDANVDAQLRTLDEWLSRGGPELSAWPLDEAAAIQGTRPWLRNVFLTPADMALLGGAIIHRRPTNYVEIGSGISTRVAREFQRRASITMPIISIDPQPRVEIESLCDVTIRQPLESSVEALLQQVAPGSLLFFDGSHRCFQNSDVTIFFLSVLPRLPAGVLVHIHDIYLPSDYPPVFEARLWSEQYLLAAWLMGGGRSIEVHCPGAHLSSKDEGYATLRARLGDPRLPWSSRLETTSSFWFETIGWDDRGEARGPK